MKWCVYNIVQEILLYWNNILLTDNYEFLIVNPAENRSEITELLT